MKPSHIRTDTQQRIMLSGAATLALACLQLALMGMAYGQKSVESTFPARPMRMIVTSQPGSAPDILARVLGQRLGESLGQQVVVDNRAGAGGVIGYETASRAQADGYTTVMSTVAFVTTFTVHKTLPYHPVDSFAPIARVASVPYILVVAPSLPVKSVKELVELAKSRPGKLNYGTPGPGTSQHLTTELIKVRTGIDMVHIPYKSGASAINGILGGEAQLFFAGLPPALPHVRSGRVRALAVTFARRSTIVPEVPTMAESGMPGIEVDQWHAIIGPAGIPQGVANKLNAELIKSLGQADTRKALLASGAEANPSSPEELRQLLRSELVKWTKAAEAAGLKGKM
jgi:tripartite-type tricarboxylate transporter receptor subunit TctC